ncbi:MAG: hypothetical protein R6X05_13140 [Desulfobacterales bacterium]|jgi:hypothetical protein
MRPKPPTTSGDTGGQLKIIIPVWEDKLSPLLDTATRLLLVEALNGAVTSRCEVLLDEADLSRRCFRIWRLEADVLICGAVSRPFARLLAAEPRLTIIQGISGPVREVLQAFLRGALNRPRFMMPGNHQAHPRSGSRS